MCGTPWIFSQLLNFLWNLKIKYQDLSLTIADIITEENQVFAGNFCT